MKKKWIFTFWKKAYFAMFCLFLSGCGSFFPLESASPLSSSSQLTHDGTVASFECGDEGIFIASSGYGPRGFTDISGKKRDEQTSILYINIDGRPESRKSFVAYSGLDILFYRYTVHVLRIGRDLQNAFTEVSVGYTENLESGEEFTFCSFS